MSTEDISTPSMQCRVYDRIAVQNALGKTEFYCLELSAGNTFDFGFCRMENVPSLLRDVLSFNNLKILCGQHEQLMIPSIPTAMWVKHARKYDPSKIIMWIVNSLTLTEEFIETIPRLYNMGMRFAVRVDAMGDIASNENILKCIDYLVVDSDNSSEFMTVINQLRQKKSDFKTIGFKHYVKLFNFTQTEARNFDMVLGVVQQDSLRYEKERPKWQHEMLRNFAQLYSSLYDIKEMGSIVVNYPLMGAAMKGMMGSKLLTNLTVRRNNSYTLADKPVLTQNDLRNYMGISIAYNLYVLTEKQICEQLNRDFSVENINFEPFINALQFAKIVEQLAFPRCDDVISPQAFLTGLLRYAEILLHDTHEATVQEFPLNAVVSNYSDGAQLSYIISIMSLLYEHKIDDALDLASKTGINLVKEELYGYIFHSLCWTDAVLRAIGIIKETPQN
ncbi:MAG: hypothetical protein ACI4NE_09055 [Succinivibrio sp.]